MLLTAFDTAIAPNRAQPIELGDIALGDDDANSDVENYVGISDVEQYFTVRFEDSEYNIPWTVSLDGDVSIQGDIVLGRYAEIAASGVKLQSIEDIGLQGLFVIGNYRWPLGIVHYRIEAGVSKEYVERAISAWSKAGIQFRLAEQSTANYIAFVAAESKVCSSPVGMRGGRQLVKIGADCRTGNIAHEIGHALGLAHEQMRSDRDRKLTFHPENVQADMEGQFGIYPSVYSDELGYCYNSLMHYGRNAFSKNGKPTLEPPAGVTIGQRRAISACDQRTISRMYASEFAKRK